MRNRIVGFLVIGIALLIGFIIFSFNQAMVTIVSTSCSHGTSCPMWGTIEFQTDMSIAIMIIIAIIGLYLVFFGREEIRITKFKTIRQQIEPKKITRENYQKIMDGLTKEERTILERLIDSKGTSFQSDIVEKTGFGKVKVTRILDRLEGKGLIERRRRGMTNVIVLKGA
jgi:uncharacterized membrane protein